MKLTSIKIQFGSIALSKARNIQIFYKGFEVQIEEIQIKSNFFNSEISNPVQLIIRDVRINKNIEFNEDVLSRKLTRASSNEPIKQIPSFLVTFFQVCGSISYRLCLLSNLFLVHGHKRFQHFLHLAEHCERPGLVVACVTWRIQRRRQRRQQHKNFDFLD